MAFYHDAPEYKCCCNNCHSTLGAKILSVIEIILGCLTLINGVLSFGHAAGGRYYVYGGFYVVFAILTIVCACCVLYGIYKMKDTFVLVGVIWHVIALILFVINVIFTVIVILMESGNKSVGIGAAIVTVIISLICLLIYIWFVLIMKSAWQYVKDHNAAHN